jgi:hypothetical protein
MEPPDVAKKMNANVTEVDKPGVGYAFYIGVLRVKDDVTIRTDADVIMTLSATYETIRVFTNNTEELVANSWTHILLIRPNDKLDSIYAIAT